MKKITLLMTCLFFCLTMYSRQTMSFESSEGFTLGDIHNQYGWTSTGCGDACNVENQIITDEVASNGDYSLKITQETAFGGQSSPIIGGFYDYPTPISNTLATFSADLYIDTFDSSTTSDYLFGLTNLTEGSFRTYVRFTYQGNISVLVDDGTAVVLADTNVDWVPLTWFNLRIEIEGANVEFFIDDTSIYTGLTASVGTIENVRFTNDNYAGFAYMDNFRTNDEDLSVGSFEDIPFCSISCNDKWVTISNLQGKAKYSIISLTGQTVLEGKTRLESQTIDANNLASGIYIVEVSDVENSRVKRKKIVIQ